MTLAPDTLSLRHALDTCLGHSGALREALNDLDRRGLTAADLENLAKEDRRLLDQFAYRYTRLQDDMGARLIPAVLRTLGEEVSGMAMIDRLNRLEQLSWLPSADEWAGLRIIRNEFTHDYPEKAEDRQERLLLAMTSARRLTEILAGFEENVRKRFPGA